VPRLLVDLKTNCQGDIAGRIDMPADSPFVLEALALVVEQFSVSCGVPAPEILKDIGGLVKWI